jgi:hypothetical protein
MPTQLARCTQYLLDLSQVLLNDSLLEKVIRIVHFLLDQLTLPIEGKDLVFHEEAGVEWLLTGFKSATGSFCAWLKAYEEVLEVGRC